MPPTTGERFGILIGSKTRYAKEKERKKNIKKEVDSFTKMMRTRLKYHPLGRKICYQCLILATSMLISRKYLGFTRPISRHVLLYRRDRKWKSYPPFSKLPALSCLSILMVCYYRFKSFISAG